MLEQQLTDHFRLSEFVCPCCGDVIQEAALELARRLEPVRLEIGAMHIVSGFRCRSHNDAVYGRLFSQHLVGLAADISCQDSMQRFDLVKALLKHDFRRVGIHPDFVHADISAITGPVIWLY